MSDPYGEHPDRQQPSGPNYGRPPSDQPVHEQETRAQQIPQQPQQTGQGYGPGYGQYGSGSYGQGSQNSQGGGPNLAKQPTPPAYGQQQYPYGQQQYGGQPGYGSPYQGGTPYTYEQAPSNGLAIASLVTSICGLFLCFIGSVVGIGLGVAALNQAKKTGAGRGMAIAGIVIGAVEIVLGIAFVIFVFAVGGGSSSS